MRWAAAASSALGALLLVAATVSPAAALEPAAAPLLRHLDRRGHRRGSGAPRVRRRVALRLGEPALQQGGALPGDVTDFSHRKVRNLVVRKAGASTRDDRRRRSLRQDGARMRRGRQLDRHRRAGASLFDAARRHPREVAPLRRVRRRGAGTGRFERHGAEHPEEGASAVLRHDQSRQLRSGDAAGPRQRVEQAAAEPRRRAGRVDGVPFDHARVEQAGADSTSFLRRGIPAVTLHGLSADWLSIIHTDGDQPSMVNPTSVYLGYRLALAVARPPRHHVVRRVPVRGAAPGAT